MGADTDLIFYMLKGVEEWKLNVCDGCCEALFRDVVVKLMRSVL